MSHEHEHDHEHEHHHEHGEDCDCGCHDHDHEHDHEHEHHHHDHDHDHEPLNVKTVDGSIVGSYHFDIPCPDRDALEQRIVAELDRISKAIEAEGGVVGHAKAAFELGLVSKISVIEDQATVDRAESNQAKGDLVVITFLTTEERVRELLEGIDLD